MKFLNLAASLLLAAPLTWAASNVLEANSATFESVLGSTPSLVEFYAPWCGHCKNLAPQYELLADSYQTMKDKVKIVKVDADGEDGKEVARKYGVTGYPTLKWFPNGVNSEPLDYSGDREHEAMMDYVAKKTGLTSPAQRRAPPGHVKILNIDNFREVALDTEKDVLVTFTAPWCGHCKAMKGTYAKVAENFKDEKDCVVANLDADAPQNGEITLEYEVRSFPTIKFFPKGGAKPVEYQRGRSEEDFTEFLNQHCGTFRAVGGGLNDEAGRVASLDTLAAQFLSAIPTSRAELFAEATSLGDSLGTQAAYYLKVMERLVNGTENYVEKEAKRLAGILRKKALPEKKLDEIKIKANILAAFVESKAEEVKGHDKAEL